MVIKTLVYMKLFLFCSVQIYEWWKQTVVFCTIIIMPCLWPRAVLREKMSAPASWMPGMYSYPSSKSRNVVSLPARKTYMLVNLPFVLYFHHAAMCASRTGAWTNSCRPSFWTRDLLSISRLWHQYQNLSELSNVAPMRQMNSPKDFSGKEDGRSIDSWKPFS